MRNSKSGRAMAVVIVVCWAIASVLLALRGEYDLMVAYLAIGYLMVGAL